MRRKAAIAVAAAVAAIAGLAVVLLGSRGASPRAERVRVATPAGSPRALPAGGPLAAAGRPSSSAARAGGGRPVRRPPARADRRDVLVRFRPGTPAAVRVAAVRTLGATVVSELRPEGVTVLRLPRGRGVEAALARLRSRGAVDYAQANHVYTIDATPNDPGYSGSGVGDASLWALNNTGQQGGLPDADIDAPEAWSVLGLDGVSGAWPTADFAVGVVDTGIDSNHPDLTGKLADSCKTAITGTGTFTPGCTDDNGHGTDVSGTIAATGNNGTGVVGVAPEAKLYECKPLDSTGSGYDADIAACINDIVAHRDSDHIAVISMSLGGTDTSDVLSQAVAYAWQNGLLVVAAAGNDGNSWVEYPAGYAGAVSVAATDRNDHHARFSNTNSDVEVAAPGVDVTSTVPTYPTNPAYGIWDTSGYATRSGTSMATPHAAAVAAVIAWRTGKTGQALRSALDSAVDDLGASGRDTQFGYGRVNLCLAVGGSCGYHGGASVSHAPVPHGYTPASYKILTGSVFDGRGALSRLFADDSQRVQIAAKKSGSRYVSDLYASFQAVRPSKLAKLRVDYDGDLTTSSTSVRLLVYDWTTSSWATIYSSGSAWTSDRTLTWSTTNSPAHFVSSSGVVRVRLRAKSAAPMRTRTDLMHLTLRY